MKIAKLSIAVLALLFSSPQVLMAQKVVKVPRWEIGFDVLFLVDQNELPTYSLFGRYLLNPEGEKKTHVRTRIGFERFHVQDSSFYMGSIGLDYRVTSVFASIGVQREILVFPKGSLYGGVDIGLSQASDRKDWSLGIGAVYDGFDDFVETQWRFSGIVGYTHHLGKNFTISLESSLQTVNTKQNWDKDVTVHPTGEESYRLVGQKSVETWHSTVQPFYQLLLGYKF